MAFGTVLGLQSHIRAIAIHLQVWVNLCLRGKVSLYFEVWHMKKVFVFTLIYIPELCQVLPNSEIKNSLPQP